MTDTRAIVTLIVVILLCCGAGGLLVKHDIDISHQFKVECDEAGGRVDWATRTCKIN